MANPFAGGKKAETYKGKSTAKADEARNRDRSKYVTEGKGDTYGLKGKPYTDKTALDKKGGYTKEYEEDSRRGLNTWTMRASDGDRSKQDLQNAKDWDNFSITRKGDKAKDDKPKSKAKDKPTPSGEIGSRVDFSESEGPNMGKVNKVDRDVDYSGLSRTATAEEADKVDLRSSGKADWEDPMDQARRSMGFKKGGAVKRSSASKRADGCCVRGKTRA